MTISGPSVFPPSFPPPWPNFCPIDNIYSLCFNFIYFSTKRCGLCSRIKMLNIGCWAVRRWWAVECRKLICEDRMVQNPFPCCSSASSVTPSSSIHHFITFLLFSQPLLSFAQPKHLWKSLKPPYTESPFSHQLFFSSHGETKTISLIWNSESFAFILQFLTLFHSLFFILCSFGFPGAPSSALNVGRSLESKRFGTIHWKM